MSVMQIDFSTDNAAFAENNGAEEMRRIFDRIVAAVAGGITEGTIHDSKGNTVGDWALNPSDED